MNNIKFQEASARLYLDAKPLRHKTQGLNMVSGVVDATSLGALSY